MALQLSFLALLAFLATINASRDARDGEFPFQVSIQNLNNEHLCGGVIITSKWVLTSVDCTKGFVRLHIGYGSVESQNTKIVPSKRIEFQKDIPNLTNELALVELEENIQFNTYAKQVKLPRENVRLVNGTITGWKANPLAMQKWNVKVVDTNEYTYITRDCKSQNGLNVHLLPDQFCLILNPAEYTSLASLGLTLSRGNVLLGLFTKKKLTPLSPIIFAEISHHGQWIADTLQEDSDDIKWANIIPNSAQSKTAINLLAVIGISYFLVNYL